MEDVASCGGIASSDGGDPSDVDGGDASIDCGGHASTIDAGTSTIEWMCTAGTKHYNLPKSRVAGRNATTR